MRVCATRHALSTPDIVAPLWDMGGFWGARSERERESESEREIIR